MKSINLIALSILFPVMALSQSLSDLLEAETAKNQATIIEGTFKATRIVTGQSIETVPKDELLFIIAHRFGTLNSGVNELFGLDQSMIRFGFEYGICENITLGIGRSSYQKLVDGFVKYKFLHQKEGAKNIPVSAVYYGSTAVYTDAWAIPERDYKPAHRYYYVHQFMIARKFNNNLSVQITPGILHRNIVTTAKDDNNVAYTGIGGRYKLTNRLTLNAEYYHVISSETASNTDNLLSFGIDIETGGHVFHLAFSNSRGLHEKAFIGETQGKWTDGFIHFGFNINRIFSLK